MTADLAGGWSDLDLTIKAITSSAGTGSDGLRVEVDEPSGKRDYRRQIDQLRASLSEDRLTLICGAGVSVDAMVPDWAELLAELLAQALSEIGRKHPIQSGKVLTKDFEKKYSNLIIAKYLKLNLGDDFQSKIREAIYRRDPQSGKIVESIVSIARPQRGRRSVESIVTFNFDDLLERNLRKQNINFKAVFEEGVRPRADELPLYHVHGYLPRDINEKGSEVVFNEEAYHTQFIDPFSWSNLIQLSKFTSKNCLFVGVSLSDPNLRRLLDVASRKSPENERNHYLIKKVPKDDVDKVDDIALLLEEQDANVLGLNMIWVQEFSEIPKILDSISAI